MRSEFSNALILHSFLHFSFPKIAVGKQLGSRCLGEGHRGPLASARQSSLTPDASPPRPERRRTAQSGPTPDFGRATRCNRPPARNLGVGRAPGPNAAAVKAAGRQRFGGCRPHRCRPGRALRLELSESTRRPRAAPTGPTIAAAAFCSAWARSGRTGASTAPATAIAEIAMTRRSSPRQPSDHRSRWLAAGRCRGPQDPAGARPEARQLLSGVCLRLERLP
jgi:hypothetical protein